VQIPEKRLAVLGEHIDAESSHSMQNLLRGMTSDCLNDLACLPKPFPGPKKVAERYRKHGAAFPDFKVRVKRILAADDKIVTENERSGTHRGIDLGPRPPRKARAGAGSCGLPLAERCVSTQQCHNTAASWSRLPALMANRWSEPGSRF
jgi:hypothetical protein